MFDLKKIDTKVASLVIIIVIIVVGAIWVGVSHKPQAPTPASTTTNNASSSTSSTTAQNSADSAAKMPITTFSINGPVTKIGQGTLTVSTGQVQSTPQGNKYVAHDETVNVSSATVFGQFNSTNKISLKDIKVGSNIIVDSQENPYSKSTITATKILLVK